MTLERHYNSGSATSYIPGDKQIQLSFTIVNTDGAAVIGSLDASSLSPSQADELCYALSTACANAEVSWVTYVSALVVETGKRAYSVEDDTPIPPG